MRHHTPMLEVPRRHETAPRMVVDERGREVGVLLGHAEYVALLAHLAAHARTAGRRGAGPPLPAYWRRALADWIPGADGAVGAAEESESR